MSKRLEVMAEKFRNTVTAENTKKLVLFPFKKINLLFQRAYKLCEQYPKTSKTLGIMTLIVLASCTIIYNAQDNLLYFPTVGYGRSNLVNPLNLRHPSNRHIQSDDIQILAKDGTKLRGWHLKNPKADKLIVYFQGNAGNIGTRLPFVQQLMAQTNSQILLVAYRGYSDSNGSPNQSGLEQDSQAILKKARQIVLEKNLKIYIFGTSLGGAVGVYAAGTQQNRNIISGLVLQNTFTSTNDVMPYHFGFLRPLFPILKLINRNPWNSFVRINRVRCPVFFVKSGKDEIIPPVMTDKLREQCNKSYIHNYLYEIPQAYHNDVHIVNPTSYFKQLNQFFGYAQKH